MVRKQYYVTGPGFSVNEDADVFDVRFENPREIQQVTISHAGFTLDLGEDPPPQLTLRSTNLGALTESRARELENDGRETLSDILGHVTLTQAHALSQTGHFELQKPITVNFGNFKHKVPEMDFFLSDHTGAKVPLVMHVVDSVQRYVFAGDWTFDPDNWAVSVALTQTWGPNEGGSVGGGINYPGNASTWSYNYNNNRFKIKWEDEDSQAIYSDWNVDNQEMRFSSEDWEGVYFANATVNLVPDSVLYAWSQDGTFTYSGTITGGVNSTWSYDRGSGILTVLWGGNASQWYEMQIDPADDSRLIAVDDYNGIYTAGTVIWQLPGSDVYSTSASGFGWSADDPVLVYDDWTNNQNGVEETEEVLEQYPYASMQLSVDAAH